MSAAPMGNEEPIAPRERVEIEAAGGPTRVEDVAAGAATSPTSHPRRKPGAGAILLAIVAVAAIVALLWPRGGGNSGPAGFLVDAGGRPAPLAQRMSRVTLLHFWASWCPPCRPELPQVVRLADDLAGERDFGVVMVAVQDQVQAAQQLAGPAAGRLLYDPNWDVAHRYGTSQLPETYLIVDGKVARKFVGAVDWDDAQIRTALKMAIEKGRG